MGGLKKKHRGTKFNDFVRIEQLENELADAQAKIRELTIQLHLIAPMLTATRGGLFDVHCVTYHNPPVTVDHVTPKKGK